MSVSPPCVRIYGRTKTWSTGLPHDEAIPGLVHGLEHLVGHALDDAPGLRLAWSPDVEVLHQHVDEGVARVPVPTHALKAARSKF